MARRQNVGFGALVQRAWSVVNEWTQSVSDKRLPIGLETLAAAQKVCAIQFEPLFSDTAVEPEGDAFLICVNTEGRGVNQKAGTRWEMLPDALSQLTPPLRFSIAHELAHLIILGLSGRKHDDDIFQRHGAALERTCNEMAGAILLPKPRLFQDIAGQLFDAAHLGDLIKSFGVSPEVFLQRMDQPDMREALKNLDGLLALVREEGEAMGLTSRLIVGNLASQRWRHVRDSREKLGIEALLLPPVLRRSTCEEVNVKENAQVEWRPGMVLPCEVTACRLYPNPIAILISIRVVGPPENVSG